MNPALMVAVQMFAMHRRKPSFDDLEPRDAPAGVVRPPVVVSDPTVPRPPTNPPADPVPAPEPSPGPFPGSNPPITYPPPPLGGPVGPA